MICRLLDEFSNGNLVAIDELAAPTIVNHNTSGLGELPASEAYKQYLQWARGVFPDMRIQVEDLVAEAAKVIVRFTAHGTHSS